jgi:hypothetical protein
VNALERGFRTAMKNVETLMADIGQANTPEMKAAGSLLAREFRKQVSRPSALLPGKATYKGKGGLRLPRRAPSAPGESPVKQTGGLAGSVGQAVVGGVRRVGFGSFKARLLDAGFGTTSTPAVAKGALLTTKGGKRRKSRGKRAGHARQVAARPIMDPALARAVPRLPDVIVGEVQRRIAAIPLPAGAR